MKVGTIISGRYEIKRLLGEGGMGAVYEAVHKGLGRRVAVKVLHANPSRRDELMGRLENEARAAASIGHVNIVDVYDFGLHDGMPFMAMEYLDGESLVARLERQRTLPIEEACLIMGQMLSALSAAHAAGIIHRDLKPDNVFLVGRGEGEIVKLLDFGISKILTTTQEGRALTRDGTVVGTPYYMSPEQAMARKELDAGGDIYSAGVMLYEMVTGQLPFYAESETEVLMAICRRDVEPRSPHEINPNVPEALAAAILKAIAFRRADRFSTAGEMLEALRPFGAATLSMVPDRSTGRFNVINAPNGIDSSGSLSALRSSFSAEDGRTPFTTHAEIRPGGSRRGVWAIGVALVAILGVAGTVLATRGSTRSSDPTVNARAASRTSPATEPTAPSATPNAQAVAPSATPPSDSSSPAGTTDNATGSAAGSTPNAPTAPSPQAGATSAASRTRATHRPGSSASGPSAAGAHVATSGNNPSATSGPGSSTSTTGPTRRPRGSFIPATTEY